MVFNRLYGMIRRGRTAIAALLVAAALSGCHPDMWNQPRYKAMSRNDAFADGMAMRLPVQGTFAYDGARREWVHPLYDKLAGETTVPSKLDTAFHTGKVANAEGTLEELPTNYFQQVTPELLRRGKERFDITCSACHGYTGDGGGIIVQRGFPEAVSLHIDRLREVNDGYLFDVITNGFGRMYSYAARVAPEDRWAVIAYIRALQYSQDVDITDPDSPVTLDILARIDEQAAAAAAAHDAHGGGHGGEHGEDAGHGAKPAHGDESGETHPTPAMESHSPESGVAQTDGAVGRPEAGTHSVGTASPAEGVPAHGGTGNPEESDDAQHPAGNEDEQPLKDGADPTHQDSEQQ